MQIQVLGSGCATCAKLHKLTEQAVAELKLAEEVEYVTGEKGIQKIVELGAMSSPVVVIDGKIVMVGFSPDIEKLKKLIVSAK